MLALLLQSVQATAARTAQTAVLGLVASVTFLIGMAFMTLAAWLVLVSVTTPLVAALILGFFYMGIALIILALMSARSRARRRQLRTAATTATAASVVTGGGLTQFALAFIAGLTAGRKARH